MSVLQTVNQFNSASVLIRRGDRMVCVIIWHSCI